MIIPTKLKPLDLIFTRSISLFSAELWYWLVTKALRTTLGRGYSDQVARFTGRSSEIYRLRSDGEAMQEHVLGLPLSHWAFSAESLNEYRRVVQAIRGAADGKIDEPTTPPTPLHYALERWEAAYPLYILCFFLSSQWAGPFVQRHGAKGRRLIEQFAETRKFSEGLFETMDDLARSHLAAALADHGGRAEDAQFIRFVEGTELLNGTSVPKTVDLAKRRRGYIAAGGKFYTTADFTSVLHRLGYAYGPPPVESTTLLRGTAASLGSAAGVVQVVFSAEEARSVRPGAILVTPMTDPRFTDVLKRVKAIVTDEGGVTCHAAIVSRELKIPCVIGTRVATKVLKDGDRVEVDATRGIVEKL